MEYVEYWRVRRSLIWHAGILAVVVLAIMALGHDTTVRVNGADGTTHFAPGIHLPISVLATIGGFFAAIYASSTGTSLNRESLTRDLSWTKPLSRTLLAVRFILIDVTGVVVAFALAMAGAWVVFANLHAGLVSDPDLPAQIALDAGVGAMWYALLQVLTCAFPPGARSLAGILWPIALVLQGLGQLRGTAGAIVATLNVLNPLGYLTETSGGRDAAGAFMRQMPLEMRALLVWLFAAAFCAIAVALWPRQEA